MTSSRTAAISLLAAFLYAPVAAACALPAAPPKEAAQSKPRKTGTIFKSEVDGLIGAIAAHSQQPGTAAPYASTMLQQAQILCAMGHCHRFYVVADNPRIRATIMALIHGRRDDGSFGESSAAAAAVTPWVVDALCVLDAEHYRDEIATAQAWLQKHPGAGGWEAAVTGVLDNVHTDVYPEHIGKPAAETAAQQGAATFDVGTAAATLVQLVACQEANRRLDRGQEPAAGAAFSPAQQKAFAFLMTQQKDGVFSASFGGKTFPDPAFTGFGLLALQTKAKATRTAAENEAIDKGMKWLLAGQNADGSFGRQLQNYTTSVVVGALARWGDPAAKPALEKAQKYILKCQNVESSGFQSSDRDYGSIGYGDSQRGDLSNVNFALQALRESGLPANDEAFQKALVFLQRSQNLKAVNDFSGKVSNPDDGGKLIDVTSGDDGGGMYYPGNSAAGYEVTPDGKSVPRSYGSMTYALLKSYTLCGVKSDDPRVQKAVDWIATNWTLEVNPGFVAPTGDKAHYAGLFYYYMVLAQSLDMAGVTTVTRQVADGKSKPIDWKKDLRARLEGMQQAGGGWLNDKNPRWMEGVDVLCTCYALLALERCR